MIRFTKMHGLGNDFAVFNGVEQEINFTSEQIKFIANRHLGIGADQIIVVKPALNQEYDFQYVIFNQDGSEVGQCGNAARCLGVFLEQEKLSQKAKNTVRTTTTELEIALKEDGNVEVNMGVPKFDAKDVPMRMDDVVIVNENKAKKGQYCHQFGQDDVVFSALSIGNPHAVIIVDDVESADVETLGPLIESHPIFPERVNVGFMQIVNRSEIKLRVYERGAGETKACGSGACAAMAAGVKLGLLDNEVKAHLTGGTVTLKWPAENDSVLMTGSATSVYHGEIEIT